MGLALKFTLILKTGQGLTSGSLLNSRLTQAYTSGRKHTVLPV